MSQLVLSSLLLLSSILLGNLFLYSISKKKVPGMAAFSLLVLAMLIHSAGYAFELQGGTLDQMYNWVRAEYLGISWYPVLIVLFTREFTDEKKIANRFTLSFFATVNFVTFFLVQTNSSHWLYYSTLGVSIEPGFRVIILVKGFWFYLQVASLLIAMSYSLVLFLFRLANSRNQYRQKVAYGLLGLSIPTITMLVYLFNLGPKNIDITPFAYLLMAAVLFVGLIRFDVFSLTPVTYEMIFNSITEAVFLVDKDDRIISFNQVMKEYFQSFEQLKVGEAIGTVAELQEYDFDKKPELFYWKGKIFHFKNRYMEKEKVWIYVISDMTESEQIKNQLEILATRDGLTGLYNRRYFMEQLESDQKKGVFIMIDIDHFKKVNDEFGHYEGDRVIAYFGEMIKKYFEDKLYCRYGGEEFLIFLQDTKIDVAYEMIEEMRKKVQEQCKVTFSAGLAEYGEMGIMETIDYADKKLYESKQNGRNQSRY